MYQILVVKNGKTQQVFFCEDSRDLQKEIKSARQWAKENCPGAEVQPMIVGCL